ncbi:MAG: anti-sigma factor antagonist [Oscillatoriales cyanobacterium RM2_1_1]|nr:anti-sigma factor antagonist [Oscillatoriales cyanobacterium RM2_1_1]
MSFNTTLTTQDTVAKIVLSGELDRNTADEFKATIETATQTQLSRLVLFMQDLEYMASAGLRVLIFAKQKMGKAADIYIVGANEIVTDTIQKTGFHHSVILTETYDD